MPEQILVAYASNAGSTAEVAKVVGEELSRDGAQVDVRPIKELQAADLGSYGAVVIGAPMILGWHRDAERFVKQNRRALSQVSTAIFVTAMTLTETGDGVPGELPVFVDPRFAKPPRNPGHLSLKERYTSLANYLAPIRNAAGDVRPVSIAFFEGKLDFGRLKFLQLFFVMLILKAQPGDYRNWDAIRGWAMELPAKLFNR